MPILGVLTPKPSYSFYIDSWSPNFHGCKIEFFAVGFYIAAVDLSQIQYPTTLSFLTFDEILAEPVLTQFGCRNLLQMVAKIDALQR